MHLCSAFFPGFLRLGLFIPVWLEIHRSKILPVTSWQLTNGTVSDISRRSRHSICQSFFPAWIGHFRVPKSLTFKMRLGAQPFLWKWVLFAWEWKNDFHIKGWAPTLVLKQRPGGTRKWRIYNMIQIHSGETIRPRDFLARSVAARPHALKLASLTFKNLWEVDL